MPARGFAYYFKLVSVGVIWTLFLLCAGYETLFIYFLTRSDQHPLCCQTPASLGLVYEDVDLPTHDGLVLSGWYLPSANHAGVILLHGYNADRTAMLANAEILAREGYGILLYDLRGHGESQGDLRAFGWPDTRDVPAAMAFLSSRPEIDPGRIGLMGFSIGGQVALRAAAQLPEVRAVIADDPGYVTISDAPAPLTVEECLAYFIGWLNAWLIALRTGEPIPPGVASQIGMISPRPLLMIAAGDERSRRLARHYYDLAGESKYLWEVPEASHGGVLTTRPQEYRERLIAFFDRWLLDAGIK